MSIDAQKKQEIIGKYHLHANDTGSADVQVAILTERIANITNHLKVFKKDYHCKRGLLKLVNRRRKLLLYIKNKDCEKYSSLIKKLGIRK